MKTELVPPADPAEEIERLRERIAELEDELRETRSGNDAKEGELTGLRAQLAAAQQKPKRRVMDGFFEVDAEDE